LIIKTKLLLFTIILLISGSQILDAARSLTIEECIQMGLASNPSLIASQALVQGAEARRKEAISTRLPTLKLSGGYTRLSPVNPFVFTFPTQPPRVETLVPSIDNNYTARLSLQQPIFTGERLSNTVKITDKSLQATKNDYARDRAQLIYQIETSYWGLYAAIASQTAIGHNVERMQVHLKDTEQRKNQGLATQNDVLRVQVQLSNAKLAQIDAKNNVQLGLSALNNLIGLELNTEVEPTSNPLAWQSTTLVSESLSALIQQALTDRPEVKALNWRIRAAFDNVALARANLYPQIFATGNFYYARPNSRIFPPTDKFSPSWDLGIQANFNVWDWGLTAHQAAEAQAQLKQLNASLTQLQHGIELEVTQDYLNLQQASNRLELADTALVQAQENQRIANNGFIAGTILNSDLLDAEVNLLQAQFNQIQSQVNFELAREKLEKTLGIEQ
jgi:outer membrane protein